MRRASNLPVSLLLASAIILCCSIVNFAQNREKFVISATAGGINAITGQASVHARGENDWQQLNITDDLKAGDRLRTETDGRVEILLNPGSYLRVGGDSEIELSDNTLANLEVRLLRGTAIVEATGADELELNINITTPHTNFAIVRQGLYRLNVVPGDATELIVRKGRVILNGSHTKVKGGNKVVFNASNVSVAKLTKEEKKALDRQEVDVWSKERAQTLAKANRRITDRMMTSAFASFRDWDPWGRRLGFWFYSTHSNCYTFLPFYYGITSPYGGSYWNTLSYYPRPNVAYPRGGYPSGGRGGSYPTGGGGGSSTGGNGGYRPSPPPSSGPTGGSGRMAPTMRPGPMGNPDRMPSRKSEPSRQP
ncbi:MAG TPA: FecR family protein [Pyrinomonadaceae bacterium]|jgi:FecR-like protein|nr:FecR family protein [Pyrinomonadaceae bacterium]